MVKQLPGKFTHQFRIYVTPEVGERLLEKAKEKALRPHEYIRQLVTLDTEGRLQLVSKEDSVRPTNIA